MRILALALLLGACMPVVVSHSCEGPARDHVGLVDRLRCARIHVEIGDRVRVPPLRVDGVVLRLSNLEAGAPLAGPAEVMSFWYDDTDLGTDARLVAAADARRFAPDGSVRRDPLFPGDIGISYPGTPHLYHRERVIAIYAGDDPALTRLLTDLLGPQFAGR